MWDLKKYGNNQVFIDDRKETMTYRELEDFSDRFYQAVGERTLLFILCTNTIGSVSGYVSCINRKVVPALLSSGIDINLLNRLIENYQPSCLWCPEDHTLTKQYKAIFREKGYCLLETGYDRKCELFSELALLLTTSGSTGSPKFVRQSYLNILSNAESIAGYLGIGMDERPITTLPMNYTYGLSIINSHILKGATIILTEFGMMQKEFWQLLKSERATSFGGVPYTYEMLVKLRFFHMDLPDLRYMTQAGGKLSPELHRQFAEYAVQNHKKFIVMYGQCEATARMSYLPAEKSLEKYGSVGIAIPGGKFRLIDVDEKEIIEPNVEGELVYMGANVTLGYAERREDLKEGDKRHGILETGDIAKRDEDGFYYIVGRKKRFLKVYGNRLNLDEISVLLKERFDNLECTSGGVDDHVYIFVTDNSYKSDSIRSYLAEKTGLNRKAFTVMTIEELPKNDAGKIRYQELEKYYLV